MTEHACSCGYAAADAEGLRDHFGEMFTPDDDIAPDGQAHAEAARDTASAGLACLCGRTAAAIAGLDEHFTHVFTPSDRTGRDGSKHSRLQIEQVC